VSGFIPNESRSQQQPINFKTQFQGKISKIDGVKSKEADALVGDASPESVQFRFMVDRNDCSELRLGGTIGGEYGSAVFLCHRFE
jgi:hypothetical protein|tara:strand:- start:175 stop:429 length:255 start_codon:yes stop_codon:yes gene_type:complete